jgi:hypothetical protein
MGRLVREQEPNEKKCTVHAASIHGGADSQWLNKLAFHCAEVFQKKQASYSVF